MATSVHNNTKLINKNTELITTSNKHITKNAKLVILYWIHYLLYTFLLDTLFLFSITSDLSIS